MPYSKKASSLLYAVILVHISTVRALLPMGRLVSRSTVTLCVPLNCSALPPPGQPPAPTGASEGASTAADPSAASISPASSSIDASGNETSPAAPAAPPRSLLPPAPAATEAPLWPEEPADPPLPWLAPAAASRPPGGPVTSPPWAHPDATTKTTEAKVL